MLRLLSERLVARIVTSSLKNGLHTRTDFLRAFFGGNFAQHHLRAPLLHDLSDFGPLSETRTELRHTVLPAFNQRGDILEGLGKRRILVGRLARTYATTLDILDSVGF